MTLEAYIFVTNRCGPTPNTSPDSLSNGESGEVFGVALHLFVTKLLGSWVMNQPWRLCGIICVQKVGAFSVVCSKGLNCSVHPLPICECAILLDKVC